VLIVVLVVILLLTYGVYGFTERMLAEARAAEAHGRAVQATALAESGIEHAASFIAARAIDPEAPLSLYHEPSQFGGVIVLESTTASAVGRFSLVAPVAGDPSHRQIRFGVRDESAKLNINAISALQLDELQQHNLLMALPGMTDELADAILDYIDEDDEIRPLGAESEYYQSLSPPTTAKNGPLEALEELLLIRDVTPEMIYGEDVNRNGLLDPSENDGAASLPLDDADGVLQPGWHEFLTIYSSETTTRSDGTEKINLNEALLTDLYDAIAEEYDEDQAQFIVAYRMWGPNDGDTSGSTANSNGSTTGSSTGNTATGANPSTSLAMGGNSNGGNTSSNPSTGSSSSSQTSPSSSQTTAGQAAQMDKVAGAVASGISGATQQQGGPVTRGGMDLAAGAKFEIKSLYDLVGRQVDATVNGQPQTLSSPWSEGSITTDMPILSDAYTATENTAVVGRININEAPYEVLIGLPDMTPEIASAIVSARVDGSGQAISESADRRTTGWLVEQDIVDLPTLRKLDRFLTARGDVFSVQSVGFFDGGGPFARIEAIIDGSVSPAKVIAYRDLTELGRGYSSSQLLPAGGQTAP
jgi:type II secretory pathway component PulK